MTDPKASLPSAAPVGSSQADVPASYSVQQFTQVNTAIPSHVWTTEVIKDLHAKQKEVIDKNIDSVDEQRERDYRLSWGVIVMLAVVIFTGLFFMYTGIQGGKEIILGTVAFVAGFLAGRGAPQSQ